MPRRIQLSPKTDCKLQTKDGLIHYSLSRSSRRRTLLIGVDEKAQVSIHAPSYSADKEILAFIHEKASWIIKKVEEASKVKAKLEARKFDHGHEFLFLGKRFPLDVEAKSIKRAQVHFDGFKWCLSIPSEASQERRRELIKKKMVQWYREQAEEVLGSRIFHYARLMGIEPVKIAVRTQKRVWGNCDFRTRTIHINWQIILAPIKVVDYVVVHEMCHLLVPNHSRAFWNKVKSILPHYEEQKLWLKTNYLNMRLP
ncbi:M48 family metallopeptidase [Candidatus Omnitrophota bacterium]